MQLRPVSIWIALSLALAAPAEAGVHTGPSSQNTPQTPQTPVADLAAFVIVCKVHHPTNSPLVTLTNESAITVPAHSLIRYSIEPQHFTTTIELTSRLRLNLRRDWSGACR